MKRKGSANRKGTLGSRQHVQRLGLVGRSGPCTEPGGEQGESWGSLRGQGRALTLAICPVVQGKQA